MRTDDLTVPEYMNSKDFKDDFFEAVTLWNACEESHGVKRINVMEQYKIKEFFLSHPDLLSETSILDYFKLVLDRRAKNCRWRVKHRKDPVHFCLNYVDEMLPGGLWADKIKNKKPTDEAEAPKVSILSSPETSEPENLL